MAAELNETLAGAAELVFDPDPAGRPSPWRTYREALERTPADATHRLVVQDDVVVCEGFVAAVEAAVASQPDRPLVFFVAGNPVIHRRAVLEACWNDLAWAQLALSTWIPAVATLWPVRLLEPFYEFVDRQRWPPSFTADDEIIGRFLRHAGEPPLASVPSLVQHPDTVPSIAGRRPADGRDPGRQAACWIGDCGDCHASRIDWTAGP
jgi:hypothetical protein